MAVDDQYTVSLMHFNSDVTDESGKTWALGGGASISSDWSKFGGKSLKLPQNGWCQRIDASNNLLYDADLDYYENDEFTVEGFIYITGDSSLVLLADMNHAGIFSSAQIAYLSSNKVLIGIHSYPGLTNFSGLNTGITMTAAGVHVAYCYQKSTKNCDLYCNGVRLGSATYPNPGGTTGVGMMSSLNFGTSGGIAYLDELRVSNTIRYSGDTYIIPTGPFGVKNNPSQIIGGIM